MSTIMSWLAMCVHVVLVALSAPLMVGLLRWLESRFLGRAGPSVFQPWREMIKLARKIPVVSADASFVFLSAPVLAVAVTATAAFLIPSFTLEMANAPQADLLVLAGLLALGRFISTLAAMDCGTTTGGMGASRVLTGVVFSAPALMLVILTLSLMAGTTNLPMLAGAIRDGAPSLHLSLALALPAALSVALAHNDLLPVDDRTPHESAMIRSAMVLEYSGRYLALLEYGQALRLALWLNLLGDLFVPYGLASTGSGLGGWLMALLVWGGRTVAMLVVLGFWQAMGVRLPLRRIPEFLGVAILLGLLAAVLLFIGQGIA